MEKANTINRLNKTGFEQIALNMSREKVRFRYLCKNLLFNKPICAILKNNTYGRSFCTKRIS